MPVAAEISTLYDIVKALLEKDARLRSDDKKLSARIWCEQIGGMSSCMSINSYEFLFKYATGELYNQESIGRARRAIQEDIPALRGLNYKKKLEHMEDVQKELGYGIDLS